MIFVFRHSFIRFSCSAVHRHPHCDVYTSLYVISPSTVCTLAFANEASAKCALSPRRVVAVIFAERDSVCR